MTRRRRPAGRLGALSLLTVLAIVASLGLSLLGGAAPARAQDDPTGDTGGNNVQGNTYTSPAFGYAISWDRTWDATDDSEDTNPTYNSLTLENDASIIVIEGIGGSGDPLAYIEGTVSSIEGDDAVSNVERTEDDLTGDVPSAVYTFDYTSDGDTINLTAYIQSQAIADGDAVLSVFHTTGSASYADEVGEREDLLANLALDGDVPEVEGGEPDDEQDAGETPVTDDGSDGASTGRQASVPGGDGDRPANEDDLVRLIDGSIADIDSFWVREFPLLSGGEDFTPPTDWVTWTGDIDTGCGPGTSFGETVDEPGDGPFYCPLDQTVYLDLNFANIQLDIVPNEFVVPVVMAHEIGHHIQQLLGLEVCSETPCLDPNQLTSQEIEYMADCWAGAWAQDAELRGRLGSGDIDANITQYSIILGGGVESADIGGHGRGAERVWWFLNGYLEGGARCLDTSSVTTGILDEDAGSPEDSADTPTADETPAADDTPTADETPVADETPETPAGTTVALNEDVELPAYTFEATRARTRDAIDTEQPDEEQFLVVYFHAEVADDGDGPFDYAGWTLVDGAGASYAVDENATNQLLSSAYENGIEEDLEGGGGYDLAMVFDVPADVSGLTLVNADAGVTVDLGV